jgi:S-disulfanyl-L-cysteine oxidoreductase SoxD
MFEPSNLSRLIAGGLAALCSTASFSSDSPAIRYRLGTPVGAAYVTAHDITVLPSGEGLPAGSGTPREGRPLFETHCAACHGLHGEGLATYPQLVGGVGTLKSSDPVLTVGSYWPYATSIWDYIRRAMPYDHPGSLSNDQVYAVTGYLLFLNGIVLENSVLDAKTLPRIIMPNRDGFVPDQRPDVKAALKGPLSREIVGRRDVRRVGADKGVHP